MITEQILSLLFGVADIVISLLPEVSLTAMEGTSGLATVLAYALYFFPSDVWLLGIGNGVVFITVSFVYAVLEWVWKKIPGVN